MAIALAIVLAASLGTSAQVDPVAATLGQSAEDGTSPDEQDGDVRLFNEYIAIIVNNQPEHTGRFAVMTTGGNPDVDTDDDSPLIYKRPNQSPWTSYTTLRVNGIDYAFGGPATERAGRAALYGEHLVGPRVVDDRLIETAYQIGPLEVWQTLTIIRSSTTGLLDTVRIEYSVINTSDSPVDVGLRMMIDTMLGANDGAPFRVGELAITTDTAFEAEEQIPEFWQAFDSLTDPKLTAQGNFKGPDLTTPDRVYLSNWGAMADGPWDFDFQPGRDFTRLGEFALDSAMALYWDPRPLMPNEERHYVTHYGLGGISISPGDLSIGVTSPSTVTASPDREVTFPVVAYVQNTGEGEARNVTSRISLPPGLRLASGEQAQRSLGNLPSGRTAQVTWRVALDGAVGGELTYSVQVEAINAEPNQVRRTVGIVSPANLSINIHNKNGQLRIVDDAWQPLPYQVVATVLNSGGADANHVEVQWEGVVGLELARGEIDRKPIGPLFAGEEVDLAWHIQPIREPFPYIGNLPYVVKGEIAGVSDEFRVDGYLDVPPLDSSLKLEVVPPIGSDSIRVGDFFTVSVSVQNLRNFFGADVVVQFDAQALELVGRARGVNIGRLFISEPVQQEKADTSDWAIPATDRHPLNWNPPQYEVDDSGQATIQFGGNREGAERPTLHWVSDTLATLRFRAKQPGQHSLTISPQTRVYDEANQLVNAQQSGAVVIVEP